MAGGRPKKFKNAKQLQAAIDAYFLKCDADGVPYTYSGLAYALDMSTQTLRNYSKEEEFFCSIMRAKQKVEIQLEQGLYNGKNPKGYEFSLRNNFGWEDKTKVDLAVEKKIEDIINEL